MDNLALLRSVPLFSQLADEHLTMLAVNLRSQVFSRGATIFQQGSPGTMLYLIRQGQVRIYTLSPLGQEISVCIFADNDFFGELALLDGRPRSASAVAMRKTSTLILQRSALLQAMHRVPEIAITMLDTLSGRLRQTNHYIEHLAHHSAPQRVVRAMLDFATRHGMSYYEANQVELLLTQDDLASLAGTSRETVNRVLGNLRDQGLIKVERACIRVLHIAQLEEVSLSKAI